jgi:hypothetical protein
MLSVDTAPLTGQPQNVMMKPVLERIFSCNSAHFLCHMMAKSSSMNISIEKLAVA